MSHFAALNPWFLIGAAAALVPLIIHLVERKRVTRVVFGSLIFLRGLVKKMARRRRTSEMILLILRMALLAVIAFAFARPLFRTAQATGEGGNRAVAILLDRSGSMKIGARMADARARAVGAIDALHAGDQVAVYAFGTRPAPVAPWTTDFAAAKAAVAKVAATDEATDIAAAIRDAGQNLAQRPESKRAIVLVSDLQASGWAGFTADWSLPAGVDFAVDRVGEDAPPPNVGFSRLAIPGQSVVGSGEEVLIAQVRNGSDAAKTIAVKLELSGKEADSREVNVPANGTTTVSFRHAFGPEEAGWTPGRFILKGEDVFPADDEARFVVDVKPKIGVLLVNGSFDAEAKRNDGFFLKRAFAPSSESIFTVTEIHPDGLTAARLADASVVVLADVDDMVADAKRKLAQFVQSGGGVIFFTGSQTSPANFNRAFADIAPCKLDRMVVAADGPEKRDAVIGEVDYKHAIFQPFATPHHGDFSRIAFSRYFAVTDSQGATVLARFEGGSPAVLLKKVGRGSSLMVTSGADLEMNNFALRAVFLPFVHQAARHLAGFGVVRETSCRVGDEIVAQVPAAAAEVTLTSPSGAATKLAVEAADSPDGGRVVRFVATELGFYRLAAGKAERVYAVNVSPVEGALVAMNPDELAASLTSHRGDSGSGALLVEGRRATDEDVEHSQRLGWILLLIGAALVAAEMTLARRIASEQ